MTPSVVLNENEFAWSKENDDPKVEHMLGLISKGHRFQPNQWPIDATTVQPTNDEQHPSGNRRPSPGLAETSQAHPIPEMSAKEPKQSSFPPPSPRKPFTRSASKSCGVGPSNPICNPPSRKSKNSGFAAPADGSHPRGEKGSAAFVTHSDLLGLKDWFSQQLHLLRSNLFADMEKLVESKSASFKSGVRPSRKVKTSLSKKPSPFVSKKPPPSDSRKRQRVEVQSLSPDTSKDIVQDGGFHAPSFDSPFNPNLPATEGHDDAKSTSQVTILLFSLFSYLFQQYLSINLFCHVFLAELLWRHSRATSPNERFRCGKYMCSLFFQYFIF